MSKIQENRNHMKCPDFSKGMKRTDQQKGVEHPPHGKAVTGKLITLPAFDNVVVNDSYTNLLDTRRSLRTYDADKAITQAQLAYMLYTAFGIQEIKGKSGEASMRPAPSGGARHAFELYVTVQNVEGLEEGLYRYVPTENVGKKAVAVEFLGTIDDYKDTVVKMLASQGWSKDAPAIIFITSLPYKAEWRYGEMAHRVVLIDLGHVGQNIMLSAVALGLGTCCVAAFDQEVADTHLKVDGNDEFTVYAITLGYAR
ncbi:MAG: SagB/ThcOx family dehydrogenase [Defluviitaleaceae bacterium]|nr:SagB/ThcOx family dehydrogenase [Defluviitaleaceae bacterium]